MDDAHWMQHALRLAEAARGTVSPNPLVGCVIVASDRVVGEGWTQPPGGRHAEVEALRHAGARARGATAYVTLEPCNHTGRTGPCTRALIDAGIGRVVAALRDPNPTAGGGAETLRAAGIGVDIGVEGAAAQDMNRVFFHGLAHDRPYVVLKQAISLDGRIAAADGTSQWLTGEAARAAAHRVRADVDGVLVGAGTVIADDPQLTVRLDGYAGKPPVRVVLDTQGRTPLDAKVYDDQATTLVITLAGDPAREAALKARNSFVIPGDPRDLKAVLYALFEHDIRSLLVEGGGAVVGAFLRDDLIDELHLHVAPVVLGERGRPWATDDGIATLSEAPRMQLKSVQHVGQDVLIRYVRPYQNPAGDDITEGP